MNGDGPDNTIGLALFALIGLAMVWGFIRDRRNRYNAFAAAHAAEVTLAPFSEVLRLDLGRWTRTVFYAALALGIVIGALSMDWSMYTRPVGGMSLFDLFVALTVVPFTCSLVIHRWWSIAFTSSPRHYEEWAIVGGLAIVAVPLAILFFRTH